MTRRARTCPVTGVPLEDVDDACFAVNGDKQLDVEWLREQSPDCDLFGLKQIAGTIYPWTRWTDAARQFRHRFGLEAGAIPTIYYPLHQLCLLGVDGPGPMLYMTHTSSLTTDSNSYYADALARSTRNQSGLVRGLANR